jgi:hypothetical protein
LEKQRICCDKQYATSRQLLFAQRNSETKYLNRIKFPAIVMLNKLDSMFYEYTIIEREKNILKTNFSDKLIEIG